MNLVSAVVIIAYLALCLTVAIGFAITYRRQAIRSGRVVEAVGEAYDEIDRCSRGWDSTDPVKLDLVLTRYKEL